MSSWTPLTQSSGMFSQVMMPQSFEYFGSLTFSVRRMDMEYFADDGNSPLSGKFAASA